jgi:hypothetical protein
MISAHVLLAAWAVAGLTVVAGLWLAVAGLGLVLWLFCGWAVAGPVAGLWLGCGRLWLAVDVLWHGCGYSVLVGGWSVAGLWLVCG